MQSQSRDELADSFYRNLEFGTGGLRGIMGVGTNRINKYTIGMATQGFANYLNKTYPNVKISVVVGHDSRNNARFFAKTTAQVLLPTVLKYIYLKPCVPLLN
jgi:phosphoglucomutase